MKLATSLFTISMVAGSSLPRQDFPRWKALARLANFDFRQRLTIALVAILSLGCTLRTIQYLARTSFWFDELAIALNVEKHSFSDLGVRPLDYMQVAPSGFLAAVKSASAMLGGNEFALRLFPWICSLGAVFLFWRIARRVLDSAGFLPALLLFAVSPSLIWYGSNVKQYSSDVAATLLLVLLALRFTERPEERNAAILGGLAGGLTMFFSHPAVVTAGVLGLALLLWHFSRKEHPVPLAPALWMLAIWAVCAGAAGFLALQQLDPETSAYMHRFWTNGFVPAPWKSISASLWIPKHLLDALGFLLLFRAQDWTFGRVFVPLCAVLALLGLFALFRKSRWTATLVLAPAAAGMLAAAVRLLPFEGRVGLYAGWPLLIAAMEGLSAATALLGGRLRYLAPLVTALVTALPAALVLFVHPPPYHAQETRPVLATLARRWEKGDRLYVYFGARHAVQFYGSRLGLRDFVTGGCHREDPRSYFREIDQFRGFSRVWFLYTHSSLGYREPEVIRSYLARIGTERDRIPDPFGAKGQAEVAAYLYDLSDPQRLATTTWDAYKFPETKTGGPRILCDGTRVGGP